MTPNAFALLLLAGFAGATAGGILVLSHFLGRPKRSVVDLTPYECGVKPFESSRGRFSVKFYLVAMLFILFDVEAAFLYPWAVALKEKAAHSNPGFVMVSMLVFLAVLAVGYVYAWGRGALEWDR